VEVDTRRPPNNKLVIQIISNYYIYINYALSFYNKDLKEFIKINRKESNLYI